MNTEKLDKLVDQIFSEMGKIEDGKNVFIGLLDKHGELICYGLTEFFIVTHNGTLATTFWKSWESLLSRLSNSKISSK